MGLLGACSALEHSSELRFENFTAGGDELLEPQNRGVLYFGNPPSAAMRYLLLALFEQPPHHLSKLRLIAPVEALNYLLHLSFAVEYQQGGESADGELAA